DGELAQVHHDAAWRRRRLGRGASGGRVALGLVDGPRAEAHRQDRGQKGDRREGEDEHRPTVAAQGPLLQALFQRVEAVACGEIGRGRSLLGIGCCGRVHEDLRHVALRLSPVVTGDSRPARPRRAGPLVPFRPTVGPYTVDMGPSPRTDQSHPTILGASTAPTRVPAWSPVSDTVTVFVALLAAAAGVTVTLAVIVAVVGGQRGRAPARAGDQ